MKCPACSNNLAPLQTGEVTVDVCHGGCGGIWFDNFELKRVGESVAASAPLLMNIPKAEALRVDPRERRMCPRCPETIMMRHFFSRRREVEVDQCPNCGGYWLDAGELPRIQKEAELERAAQKVKEEHPARVLARKSKGSKGL